MSVLRTLTATDSTTLLPENFTHQTTLPALIGYVCATLLRGLLKPEAQRRDQRF